MVVALQILLLWRELPGKRAASSDGLTELPEPGSTCEPEAQVAVRDGRGGAGASVCDYI